MAQQKYVWKSLGRIPLTNDVIKRVQERSAAWSWRVFRPVVDYDLCTKCWTCVNFCPEGVIAQADDGPEIDYNLCKGCGVCSNECPSDAITMERER